MSLVTQFKVRNIGKETILYDESIISEASLSLFNNKNTASNSERSASKGIGRAKVVYFTHAKDKFVLKHYYRGGVVAVINRDKYLGINPEKTRAFREWRLLKKMQGLGLPVPMAVAARVEKGLFYYKADLLTREIENATTLADCLLYQNIDECIWEKVGACIKLFHNKDIYHADLNARNILLVEDNVYLIDFDNSDFRVHSDSWKMANLSRLKRSLLKFKKNEKDFHFDETVWSSLIAGYNKIEAA